MQAKSTLKGGHAMHDNERQELKGEIAGLQEKCQEHEERLKEMREHIEKLQATIKQMEKAQ